MSSTMAVAKTTKTKAPAKKAVAKKAPKTDGFAVIATGGKQYIAQVGDTLTIEKLAGDFKKGDSVTFDQVLLSDSGSDTIIGAPTVSGASVTAEITTIGRAQKVTVLKYKQKSRYQKKNGHRQPFFKVKITAIK